MKKYIITIILLLFSISSFSQNNKLWYLKPAGEWMEALPIGNGRLGAMIYGGIETETIALNESTMWSGQYDENQEPAFGKEKLNELRKLFFDGKISEGNHQTSNNLSGTPHSFGSHLPIGDLKLNFVYPAGDRTNYQRELNLENAISCVSFDINGTEYKREYFGSNPDNVLVFRFSANKAKSITMGLSLDLLRESKIEVLGNQLEFSGQASFPKLGPGGVNFIGKIAVLLDGGSLSAEKENVNIKDANSVIVVVDIRTDYKSPQYKDICAGTIKTAQSKKYDKLKSVHIDDYSKLYKRVDLSLGLSGYEHLPTDARWKQIKDGKNDIGLDALFFQYGRYLLIASSRKNSPLPANLQGIWNDNLACNMGWTNDYHLDINTEQNYWISNIGNLHDCNKPLFDYIKDLSVHGRKTAQKVYGSRGWTAHTVANVWGYTAPGQSVYWGLFPTASSWIASHLWTQYIYTQDESFLEKVAYPLLKGNAEFLLDYMIEDPKTGYMMTGPSISPENGFRINGEGLGVSMMPTCDRQLAYEIFSYCIEASKILDIDRTFADSLKTALSKLPPIRIGKNGGVQEWFEDYEESSPNHRHTSHLLGLYPFSQITLEKTPDLAVAAAKTIQLREAAEGWEDVEWSRANMICNHARLKNSGEAYRSVVMLQKDFTRENLLTISPKGIAGAPYDIFIFDGNTAGAAGIAEMLIQAHEGYIEFLPSLPAQWKTGYFKGLCVPGGAEIDVEWENESVKKAVITATSTNIFKIKLPETFSSAKFTKNGKTHKCDINNGILTVNLKKGDKFNIII